MDSAYKKTAVEAAIESGLFIRRSVGKIAVISYKGRSNIVTDVDRRSESMIIKKLQDAFPDHSILSEESSPIISSSSYKWIIDPLDGTTNFAHAFPFFCVSIALEAAGRTILGVVYDPIRDELFYAERDKGAYLNDKKIAVSDTRKLSDGFLATGFSYGLRGRAGNVKYFRDFLMKSCAVRRAGSAALDMCYVACGRFDGFWEMGLHPWDSAAAFLIVQEAGGRVTKFDGSKYMPYDKEVLAANRYIHKPMVNIFTSYNKIKR
jgi:myo-inositol-1(or 4)-monophosphatase